MRDVKYSFIIPHHNCPTLLQRCLNSIPEREDIQIIVVDDNSDEGKKPTECGRSEVEYIYLRKEESKGAGHARNRGLEKAKGKWLLFPDADDYYNVDFLKILDRYKASSSDVIYFNFDYRDGKTLELLPDLPFKKYFELYDGTDEFKEEIRLHHNVPWTKMVSCEYIKKYNIKFEEVPNGNDILFSMLVGYCTNNIIVEKQCLYVYLKNEQSITTNVNKTTNELICFIAHRIKLNYLYRSIGHKEWTVPLFRSIVYFIKQYRLRFLLTLINQLGNLYESRKNWADLVKSKGQSNKSSF